MSEKAIWPSPRTASPPGAYVIFGVKNPVEGSDEVTRAPQRRLGSKVGGKMEFVVEPEEMVRRTLEHIDKKRAALGLPAYDPQKFGRSGDCADAGTRSSCSPAERRPKRLYGTPVDG